MSYTIESEDMEIDCSDDDEYFELDESSIYANSGKQKYRVQESDRIKDIVRDILEEDFENLRSDSVYWAPEIYWHRIKMYTGVDIEETIRIYFDEPVNCSYICKCCHENKLRKIVKQFTE